MARLLVERERRILSSLELEAAFPENRVEGWDENDLDHLCESRLLPLLPRLRKGLLHTTGARGLAGILRSGAILPNDGSLPDTFGQSRNSYSRVRKAVALFDFESPTPTQFVEQFSKCAEFFTHYVPRTFVLQIDPAALGEGLIRYAQATAEVGYGPTKIPHLEVWYPGEIPLQAVTRVLVIDSTSRELREFEANDPQLIALVGEPVLPVRAVKADTSKTVRAAAVTPVIEAGKVFLPETAPWLEAYLDELSSFPAAPHDDMVDSTTQALNWFREKSGPSYRAISADWL